MRAVGIFMYVKCQVVEKQYRTTPEVLRWAYTQILKKYEVLFNVLKTILGTFNTKVHLKRDIY